MNTRIHLPSRLWVQRALMSVACLLLGLALFAPPVKVNRPVFDLLAVLDITQSMNVFDYHLNGVPASRLAFAKHALHGAVLKLPCGSKLGLAVFTEYRTFVLFTPVEVCHNRAELLAALDALNGQMAWANASEIAKGLFWGIRTARDLQETPALIFFTDGHEAPPLNPRYRPLFDGRPSDIQGMIVGVGSMTPQPIPKIDPEGQPAGFWRAEDVQQTDPYARGRAGSVANEQMTETGAQTALLPQDQPSGREQLSTLHEKYLKVLASETGLHYRRLSDAAALSEMLTDPKLAREATVLADMRWIPGSLALLALVAAYVPAKQPRHSRR